MIRFYNGRVLSFTGGIKISRDEVWTDGGRIAYVGAERKDAPRFEREIDLRGDLLMPGFKDAHTHTAMTFLRSFADDMPLSDWLYQQVFPNEAKLDDEMIYTFTKLGIMEYLSSGITSSFDMYMRNEAYAKANVDCGFRTVICSALNNFDADEKNIEREYLRFNDYDELVSYRLGIHAEYTTGMERMKYMASLAEKYKEPCFMHLCETESEVKGCVERWGMTPPQLLDSIGMFAYGGGGFHCVHMTEHDLEIFRDRGLWAVTNPGSNAKLASGIAPLEQMRALGIHMAIGTDGPSSNNALDFFREMYLAAVLQKLRCGDAAALPADDVLHMATVGGAQAMGLTDCDVLAPGKQADLIVIDLQRPNMQPVHNVARNLVYSGSKENVRLTMVAGRVLYENGAFFVGEPVQDIYRAVDTAFAAMRAAL